MNSAITMPVVEVVVVPTMRTPTPRGVMVVLLLVPRVTKHRFLHLPLLFLLFVLALMPIVGILLHHL
jgi:hypothetical protein